MITRENVPLAPLTTFGVGGTARFFVEAHTENDIGYAIAFAKEKNLRLIPLGNGSNVLVPDDGVNDAVIKIASNDISFIDDGDDTLVIAGAGAQWDKVVGAAGDSELFGIENLAGIPGTVGGAVVQNIGAYGAELANVFEYADVINSANDESDRINIADAEFTYRSSIFKKRRELIVTRLAMRLSKIKTPNLNYPDLARARDAGTPLNTPAEIASTVRIIRAEKFPNAKEEGTAGSFFKNPIISNELANSLAQKFSGLPTFPQENGLVKVSLAWLLDHALFLKGFSKGNVRLYEKQPLILVANAGATATEVDAFANEIAERVFKATAIRIEREVEIFGTQK